ncbi:MAG: serine hydrolase [Pyrinomonadaceae bacterium]|nr:serine hydrolase [Phycisphaerales bacterium]
MNLKAPIALCGPALLSAIACAQPSYDFSEVTALAQGALVGENVNTPVPGFELLLLKDGRTVYRQAFGTWFLGRIANADSATKTLSGALIMSLTDSSPRPFSLDTRLSDYIPEFDGQMQDITIRQCFSHTAGFDRSGSKGDRTATLYEAALDIANDTLSYAPGSTFSYGGVSMHAAGAVAEIAGRVGTSTWNDLFLARIAGPLNMVRTRYVLTTPTNPRIAGGCESNAVEFSRFMEMLRLGGVYNGTRILSENAVATMFTRQVPLGIPIANTPLGESSDYGVGVWLDQRDEQGELIGAIAAGARGFSSWIDFDDGMVGALSTDLSASGNVQALLYLLRDAAQTAIRNPLPCLADFNNDNSANSQDFFDFLVAFFAGDPAADFNQDAAINSQDFFDFLAEFFAGC